MWFSGYELHDIMNAFIISGARSMNGQKLYMQLFSLLAQSVEHAAVNRGVVGSSPTGGALYGVVAKW